MENLSGNDAQFIYGSGIKQPFSREEQGIYKKPIEHHGGVWMWGLVGGGYMKLCPEDAEIYRIAKRRNEERKR